MVYVYIQRTKHVSILKYITMLNHRQAAICVPRICTTLPWQLNSERLDNEQHRICDNRCVVNTANQVDHNHRIGSTWIFVLYSSITVFFKLIIIINRVGVVSPKIQFVDFRFMVFSFHSFSTHGSMCVFSPRNIIYKYDFLCFTLKIN